MTITITDTQPLEGIRRGQERTLFALSNGDHVLASSLSIGYPVETYLFPADSFGEVQDWGELPGSLNGEADIPEAIAQHLAYLNQEEEAQDDTVAERRALADALYQDDDVDEAQGFLDDAAARFPEVATLAAILRDLRLFGTTSKSL